MDVLSEVSGIKDNRITVVPYTFTRMHTFSKCPSMTGKTELPETEIDRDKIIGQFFIVNNLVNKYTELLGYDDV